MATTNQADAERLQLEKRPRVEARTGLSCSAIYAAMKTGNFPKPVRLAAKSVAWRSDEIDAWINSRPRAAQ